MKLFIFSGVLVFSLIGTFANATVKITSITGASVVGNLSTTPIFIAGGASGSDGLSYVCGGTTCNTCNNPSVTGTLKSCNENGISGDTQLIINFTSTASGTVEFSDGTNYVAFVGGNVNYTAGTAGSVSIRWSDLCGATGLALCGSSPTSPTGPENISKSLYFGVSNGTSASLIDSIPVNFVYANMENGGISVADGSNGVDDFQMFPGDQKAYIDSISPDSLGSNVSAVRAYYAPISTQANGCAEMGNVTNSSDSNELALDNTSREIIDNRVSGLENDTPYVFRFAIVDNAKNIGLFTVQPSEDPSGTINCTAATVYNYTAQPQEVFGLLEKNQQCFITTAAYGSPLDAKVIVFKKFRDVILKKYALGRSFIEFYYSHSPKWAAKIRQNETARAVTRVFLWPLWAMSVVVIKIGLAAFLAILASLVLIFALIKKKYFRPKHLTIFVFVILGSLQAHAQDDGSYFDLNDDTNKSTATAPAPESATQETAPQEPPYTGTENDEYSNLDNNTPADSQTDNPKSRQQTENYNPKRSVRYEEHYNKGTGQENPKKWRPFERVPEEERLKDMASEGLFKITKKGEYVYDVPHSPQHHAASFRVAAPQFGSLKNVTENGQEIRFSDIYGNSRKPMLMVDYEWQFFQGFGKLGLKFGTGLMVATGHGQFANPVPKPPDGASSTTDAEEKYNFFLFPNSLSAVYRLDIFKRQWVVPFAEGGVDYFTFFELRDDGKGFKVGGARLAHFAIGGSFLLDILDRQSAAQVDREYGVSHMWLTAEFRRLQNLGSTLDFSDNLVDAGIMFEF